eukprot:scpid33238/ scgid0981/ Probable transporter mch1
MKNSTVMITVCGRPVMISRLVPSGRNALVLLALFAAICGMSVSGFLYSFNSFADALKEQLSFTQTQVEWISSVANIGSCIGITAGLFMQRFGAKITVCVAALLSFAGFFVVAASIEHRIPTHFSLMCIYFFVMGQGGIFTYMACMMTTAVNFSPAVRGTVIGLVDSMYGGSAAVFSTIYTQTYGASSVAREQDVAGFFYAGAAIMAAVNLFLFVALLWMPWKAAADKPNHNGSDAGSFDATSYENSSDMEKSDSFSVASGQESVSDQRARTPALGSPSLQASAPHVGSPSQHSQGRSHQPPMPSQRVDSEDVIEPVLETDSLLASSTAESSECLDKSKQPDLNTLQLFLNVNFQLLFWAFALATGVGLMFMSNVLFFLKAYGLEDDRNRKLFTTLLPVCSLVSRFLSGIVSDAMHARFIPRSLLLLVASAALLVAQALLLVQPDSLRVLLVNTTCVGISYGSMWCLVPTIMTHIGGLKYFGQNWGIVMLSSALAGMAYQELYGKVYDDHVHAPTLPPGASPRPDAGPAPTESTCYGSRCFAVTTYVSVASCALSFLMVLLLFVRDFRTLRKEKKSKLSTGK